jgi:7-carboxy-7-deazaguanine synthase
MSYAVKEMFLTLQGEGVNAGARAVFVRFAGCNLWSGREQDRAAAVCKFCDTDFVGTDGLGGGKFADAAALAEAVAGHWGAGTERRFVVLTGGTLPAHPGIDWVCISPKAGSQVVQRRGDELKLVWPQPGSDVAAMEGWDFAHFLIQPMDDAAGQANVDAAVAFALERPRWRLTLQTHKFLGLR